MTSNAQLTLEKCVFLALHYVCVCVCVCVLLQVCFLYSIMVREVTHIYYMVYFLSASFSGRGPETSHKGGIDSVAQHIFLPAVPPVV